jgi:ketosteroid isomerase-like protein
MQRLLRATNAHDLEALVGCFAEAYRNETPAHPARGFSGREQVRKNWQTIFGAVPDITAEAKWTTEGATVWSEWEMRGTRRDGAPHLMRGVVIFGLAGEAAEWARFYLEPVDDSTTTVDAAVQIHVGGARA